MRGGDPRRARHKPAVLVYHGPIRLQSHGRADVDVLLAQGHAWPRGDHARVAAVSSFGFSGTNAHVIIEEGDAAVASSLRPSRPGPLVPLTARTPEALRTPAASYAHALDEMSLELSLIHISEPTRPY